MSDLAPIDGPHLKDPDHYLSNPEWVGDAVPERYMGWPWGLGGECWFVRAYRLNPDSERGWDVRRTFAGMDPEGVRAAAEAWLAAGAPVTRSMPTGWGRVAGRSGQEAGQE